MKRRVLSIIISFALCLDLCPIWVLAAEEGTDGGPCPHHQTHTAECGYSSEEPGAPCTFVCEICPTDDLHDELTENGPAQVDLPSYVSLLAQGDETDDETELGSADDSHETIFDGPKDDSREVTTLAVYIMNGNDLTVKNSTAIKVTETGKLYLKGPGKLVSQAGAGVEVKSGGFLSIEDPGITITGSTYGLDIASGAEVHLSGGTFSGKTAAIRAESGDPAALLEHGHAYFVNGKLIKPADAAKETKVAVGQCTDHPDKTYTHDPGTTTHTWTCPYCGAKEETEPCTFTFDQDGKGTCASCGNTTTIAVDENGLTDLVYDGNVKPGTPPPITVALTDDSNKVLVKKTDDTDSADYEVDYKPRADAGEITVTVTGITFNGTFTKTYHVGQDQPGIRWDNTTCAVDYDGSPVNSTELPHITITIKAPNNEDLHPYLQYFYRKAGDTEFTPGLPTNAGTYEIKAYIPESQNYKEAETKDLLTLTINKIPAVATAPTAKTLTYDRTAQQLVTAGTGYGGKMVYSTDGTTYSDQIPAKISAGEYTVYYKVAGDDNHSDPAAGSLTVTIAPKPVTATIELTLTDNNGDPLVNYTYDGNAKEPAVKVLDGSTVIDTDEYNVIYSDNTDAGKGTVSITDKPGGNYTVTGSAAFVIQKADIVFAPDPSAAAITYDGKPHELLNEGTFEGGTVEYALGSKTSTYTAAIPTATNAGDYTVWYKVTGDKNHNDLAVQSVAATIQRKPLTAITIELSPEGFAYDGTPKLPQVTVKDGKTVLPKEEYDWSCDPASPTNVGTYTITISDKTGGNYDLTNVTNKTATFTIGQVPQKELVIGGKPAATNYGDSFQLTVSGGSGTGAVTWEATTGLATVDNNGNVTITGVGEVTITVEQAADTNYLSTETQWTFTAAPKPVEATVTVNNKAYDGNTSATVTSASIPVINSDTVTITSASITAAFESPVVGTGKTVTLDVSKVKVDGADAAKYAISYPAAVTADITQATTTITTDPASITPLTYNGQPQALVEAGKTNVGFIVYSLDGTNFSPEIPTATNAGTYSVYYKVDGTADYTGVDANTTPVTVTIDPKSITPVIEVSESSYLYDGTKKVPKITVKDDTTVIDGKQYTVTWANDKNETVTELKSAGKYTATIKNVDNGNYTFSETATVEIVTASQAAVNITGQPEHVYYGDTITTLGTTGGTGEGTVKWTLSGGTKSTINENTGVLEVKDTDELTVTAKREVLNYAPVSATWTFTVEPKPVTAVVTVANKAYDGNNEATITTVEVKSSDKVNSSDTISITGLKGTFDNANAGTGKTVTLDQSDSGFSITCDTDKYTVTIPATAQADITPRRVTVTVTLSDHDLDTDADGKYFYTFDGTEKRPAVAVTGTATDDASKTFTLTASDYTVDYAKNKNVGEATVTVTAKAGGNYTFNPETVNFEIRNGAAVLTETPEAKALTYDGTDQDLVTVGTATGGKVVYSSTENGTYSETIPQGKNAGTYTVYYMVKGDGNHDDTTPGQVSVTIRPKEITPIIALSQDTYTYDGNECKPTVTVEDGSDTVAASEYTVSYRDNTNAGTATVIVSNNNEGNYIVNGTGTFTIEKAAASVTTAPTGNEDLPYNGAAQALLATAGSASGGTMVYSLDKDGAYSPAIPTGTAVGDYTVWCKVQGDSNHSDTTPASVTASIIKNTVTNPTVQVTPEAVTWNGQKQEPTVKVIADGGLVIDGSEYTVTYKKDGEGNEDDSTVDPKDVGKYTLTIEADGNYSFTATAAFEILPADQTPLTITNTRERIYYGDTIQLGTTGGSGKGTVTWEVDNGAPANIDTNGLLTITGVGSVTVTATSTAPGYADKTATWPFVAEKKPVTAVVTAEAKTYDGKKDAAVTATLQSSDLVSGDDIKITLSGSFEDANAGTNKKVTVDSTDPKFGGSTGDDGNYSITYPATTTASIFKADVTDVTAPTVETGLEYTGLAQALVTAGSSTEGTLEYSTDGLVYSASLPTGTDAKGYDVWYRVKGDGNHNDTAGTKLTETAKVTIAPQTVTDPTIEFTPSGASYDGAEHKPGVTVKDNDGRVIPGSEYEVTYDPATDWTKVGEHKVTIKDKDGGNYNITEKEAEFEISMIGQNPLSITGRPGTVHYGDTFTLSAVGGSGTGTVSWVSSSPEVASIDQNGLVKVGKSGSTTITATKAADGNYGATTATWTFSAEKKPVKAIVTAKDKEFDTTDVAQLEITWKDGDLLNGNTINLTLTGTFNNANVGDNKTVKITGTAPPSDKYDISWNSTTTASITPKAATVTAPTSKDLTYTGQPQDLVNAGSATNGTINYSLDGIIYGPNVPKGTNADQYLVWYKVSGDENYKDVAPAAVRVTISPKPLTVSGDDITLSPEIFDYDGTAKKPDVTVKDGNIVIPASEYTVSYSNNIQAGTTAKATISDVDGGNYIVSGSTTFTIKSGTATLTLAPQAKDLTYTGSAQTLVTAGTAVNGRVMYSLDGGEPSSTAIPKGTDAGDYDVYYKVVGNAGYGDTDPEYVTVTIAPKQVTPTVQVGGVYSYSTPYTGSAVTPDVTVIVDGKQLTSETDYYISGYSNNTNPGTASVTVQSTSTSNYQFFATATFEITKVKATFLMEPKAKTGLVYTGEAQNLVDWGMGQNGATVVYSLNGGAFYPFVPMATEVGSYVVSAKVQGNEMYADSDVKTYRVTIGKNTIAEANLDVTLSVNSLKYTGSELKPTVTVRDGEGNIIAANEYSVSYSNNINMGTADVTVTSTGKNYSFSKTVHFTITDPDAPALTITGKKDAVYYGDTLQLGTIGGSGTVTWSVDSENAESQGNGRFKITGSGSITVKAAAGDSSDTWTFYADPKPVTATVIAKSKTYDGNTDATDLLTVTYSGLLSGDDISSVTATGQFVDTNVGTQTIVVTLNIPNAVKEKYAISCPATVTATITAAEATVSKAPTAKSGLQYDGTPQELVTKGEATGGKIKYSLDGETYTYAVPTGTNAKSYTVWYKVVADDDNYKDSKAVEMAPISIAPNTTTPTVECKSATFTGAGQTPTVVVTVGNRILPENEYTVKVTGTPIEVGDYTVTVTDNEGGNYKFDTPVTATFTIVTAGQNPVSIVNMPASVCYGDTFRLSATGGSGSGAIQWKIAEGGENVAKIDRNGVVKVIGTGAFTVEAYREGSNGYSDSNTDTAPFVADKKTVTPTVTAANKPYDGNTDATLAAKWKDGDLVGTDNIVLNIGTGTFETADVGTNKVVTFSPGSATGDTDKYDIKWPESTTASITRVDAKIGTAPAAADLTYNNTAQPLVTSGTTVGGIGAIVYSTSQNGTYTSTIPTGTNAGTYTVWYKVADSVNYTGIPTAEVKVEIKKADPNVGTKPTATSETSQKLSDIRLEGGAAEVSGKFAWKDGSITPVSGTSYDVIFTPDNTANYNTVTILVQVTAPVQQTSNPASTQTTIRNGTASTAVSASDGSKLVREAVANQSRNVVIKPEITSAVTKTEVSIPSSTVSRLSSETDAALTVSSPVADVTIPNRALDTLSQAGGTVDVVTEQVDQGVALTLTAGGKEVENVPGGLTLAIPVEDAGPGSVAVLVHDDGTRETLRKSVVEEDKMYIPLSGPATVEIVDNSKDFTDVSSTSWASDAVAFASAHELFNGTSETTFGPDQPMSRGMLATVLYNLEGHPDQDTAVTFSDIDNDAWYADGVAWAAANGVTSGYGDGRFGPNDNITREQFAVMLWKYAGSPEAKSKAPGFTDMDQASGYALEALSWAVETGILSGHGNGQLDPGGIATRAQAAQMLKNFMENA